MESSSHTYQNNRVTNNAFFDYDADGRETSTPDDDYRIKTTYDAAGQIVTQEQVSALPGIRETTRIYDGEGRQAKKDGRSYVEVEPDEWAWQQDGCEYFIRATALGGEIVSKAASDGGKLRTYVRAAGAEIAWQNNIEGTQYDTIAFQHRDATANIRIPSGSEIAVSVDSAPDEGIIVTVHNQSSSDVFMGYIPGVNSHFAVYMQTGLEKFSRTSGQYEPFEGTDFGSGSRPPRTRRIV